MTTNAEKTTLDAAPTAPAHSTTPRNRGRSSSSPSPPSPAAAATTATHPQRHPHPHAQRSTPRRHHDAAPSIPHVPRDRRHLAHPRPHAHAPHRSRRRDRRRQDLRRRRLRSRRLDQHEVEVYDPATDTWSRPRRCPAPRHHAAALGVGGVFLTSSAASAPASTTRRQTFSGSTLRPAPGRKARSMPAHEEVTPSTSSSCGLATLGRLPLRRSAEATPAAENVSEVEVNDDVTNTWSARCSTCRRPVTISRCKP